MTATKPRKERPLIYDVILGFIGLVDIMRGFVAFNGFSRQVNHNSNVMTRTGHYAPGWKRDYDVVVCVR